MTHVARGAGPSSTPPPDEGARDKPVSTPGASPHWEIYNEHEEVMGGLRALLHGAYACREFWEDKNAELNLISQAQELCEEARALGENLYQACRAEQTTPAGKEG